MKKLTNFLTGYIVGKEIISKKDANIYQYGFQMGLEVLICTITGIGIAIKMDMVVEYGIFLGVFVLIRSYTGGMHLDRFCYCFICSCIVEIAVLAWSARAIYPVSTDLGIIVGIEGLIYLLSVVLDNSRKSKEKEYFKGKIKKILCLIIVIVTLLAVGEEERYLTVITNTMIVIAISLILKNSI